MQGYFWWSFSDHLTNVPRWISAILVIAAVKGSIMALIWWGVRWARLVLLGFIGCYAALVVWGLIGSMAINRVGSYLTVSYANLSVGLVVALFTGYLLLQPESRRWFYR